MDLYRFRKRIRYECTLNVEVDSFYMRGGVVLNSNLCEINSFSLRGGDEDWMFWRLPLISSGFTFMQRWILLLPKNPKLIYLA